MSQGRATSLLDHSSGRLRLEARNKSREHRRKSLTDDDFSSTKLSIADFGSRCIGCHTCAVACADWHDTEEEAKWLRVTTIEQGNFPDVFVSFLMLRCCRCEQPDCVAACPVGAITKRADDGIVVVDRGLCLGKNKCDLCLQACHYQIPQFGAEDNAKMQKCDLCLERVTEGQQPVCVEACPMWALDYGPLDQLRARYGDVNEAVGFAYAPETRSAIIFKLKKNTLA